MISNYSFFGGSIVTKGCRPTLECFEVEGERILSRREATTLIDHHFVSRKKIPSLIVGHLVISVRRSSNVFWSTIYEIGVILGLTIRNA